MYIINLFKLNGLSSSGDIPGQFVVVGSFASLEVKKISNLSDVFTYNNIFDNNRFTSHSMVLYEVNTNNATNNLKEHSLAEEMVHCQNSADFYAICSFKINPEIVFKSETKSGVDFINYVADVVGAEINNYCSENNIDIKYEIWGNLGSFDITVITRNNNINELLNVPHYIRGIEYKPTGEDENIIAAPMFCYSSSLIAFSTNFSIDKMEKEQAAAECNVVFNFSAFGSVTQSIVKEIYDYFSSLSASIKTKLDTTDWLNVLFGNHDFSVALSLSQKDFVKVFVGSDGQEGLLDICSKRYVNNFRNTHTTLLKNTKLPLPTEIYNDGSENAAYQLSQVFEKRNKENDELKSKLFDIYTKVKKYIPDTIKHTVDNSIVVCLSLLNNDLRYISGLKLYSVLVSALNKINETVNLSYGNSEESLFQAISRCFQDISMILPSIRRMDTYALESIDNADSISPLSKLFFSIEYLLADLINKLDTPLINKEGEYRERKSDVFLTIGNEGTFTSVQYFSDYSFTERQNRLISFNLPNASSLSLDKILPYILHEVNHYTNPMETKEKRNICMYRLLRNYLLLFIQYTLKTKLTDENIYKFAEELDKHYSENKYSPNEYMSLDKCAIQWIYGAYSFSDKLVKSEDETDVIVGNVICMLLADTQFAKAIRYSIYEAYADFMMIQLGNYDVKKYIQIMYNFLALNNLNAKSDLSFVLRITAVLGYYCNRENGKFDNETFASWVDKTVSGLPRYLGNFIYPYCENIVDSIRLVEPTVLYLSEISVDKNKVDCDVFKILEHCCNLETEVSFHVNCWYKCLQEMGVKK